MTIDLSKLLNNHRSMSNEKTVLIIDGTNLFVRCFCAYPTLNTDGHTIGGAFGFLESMFSFVKTYNINKVIVVFDGQGGSVRRKKMYKGYKSGKHKGLKLNRLTESKTESTDKESERQIRRLIEYLNNLPVVQIIMDGVEADDVISILVNSSELDDYKYKFIMSSDKDYLQLVSENIQVYNPTKKIMYSPKKVVEEFGIIPENFVYYKAFIGDRSDNIPSFGSIGEKNIIKFFPEIRNTKIEDLDFFYNRAKDLISEGKKYKGLDNLISDFDKLELNYKLIQLHNVDVSYHTKSAIGRILQDFVPSSYDYEFMQMFAFDGLFSRINDFDSWHRNFVNRLKS